MQTDSRKNFSILQ